MLTKLQENAFARSQSSEIYYTTSFDTLHLNRRIVGYMQSYGAIAAKRQNAFIGLSPRIFALSASNFVRDRATAISEAGEISLMHDLS